MKLERRIEHFTTKFPTSIRVARRRRRLLRRLYTMDDNEELRETTPTAAAPIPSPPSSPRDSATDSQAGDIFCDALEALEEIGSENEALPIRRRRGGHGRRKRGNNPHGGRAQFLVKNLDTGLAVPLQEAPARLSNSAAASTSTVGTPSSRRHSPPNRDPPSCWYPHLPRRRRACRHTTPYVPPHPWSWRIISLHRLHHHP